MVKALSTAATGMIAQQLNIDVISNNMANINTTGYKKVRAEFQDLLSQTIKTPGALISQGTNQPVGIEVGLGTKTSGTQRLFTAGTLSATKGTYDLAIEGDGFFQVQLDDGTTAYTRDGSFKLSATGQLTTTDGYIVQPEITIPSTAKDVTITSDGSVSVTNSGETSQTTVGQIQLAKFVNPAGLVSAGSNLYKETSGSGTPTQGTAGQEGFGTIQQGYLEGSNVQIVEEMINLIQAERAFEANSKVISTSSQILQTANNIVR
jgi:flagellar basal-body rod protein FlgG